MAPEDQPEVAMVPVKRYDVNISLADILTPLTRTAAHLSRAKVGRVDEPEVAEQLGRFTKLVNELHAVSMELDRMDPRLLAHKSDPPPDR